jgi:hypothetical protein
MRYKAYILKTTVYRIELSAGSRKEAERLALEALEDEETRQGLETVDSWWDDDGIEVEEELFPEEESLLRGSEMDCDTHL